MKEPATKSSALDSMLQSLDIKPHPAHGRHHTAPHHWSASVLLIIAIVALVAVIAGSITQANIGQNYVPPSIPLKSEASTTLTNMATDYSQINAADLTDGNLAR